MHLKPGVHIVATIAIAQKEFNDQNDCLAWCPYNRYDRYSSKRIQRSERLYGNRALSDRSIAMIAIAEIENVLSQRSLRSLRFHTIVL